MAQLWLGQIITFAGNFAIQSTAMCNGQLLSIAQNQALFAVIGTFYGGDGVTTFGLPNLKSRRMNHQGQGIGLSNYQVGQIAGVEGVTLSINNMPSHTHTITGALNASGLQPQATTEVPVAGSVLGHAVDISGNTAKAKPAIYCPAGTTANIGLAGLNVAAAHTGSGLPLQIIDPYLTINMLILLQGIFPSRN
jgi:microcystin-dependent protein